MVEPRFYQLVVSFDGTGRWILWTPAKFFQETAQIIRMIGDIKLAFDQVLNAPQCPPIGWETRRQRAAFQQSQQRLLLMSRELGWAATGLAAVETTQAAGSQTLGPLANSSTANAQTFGDQRF
jgi:hypothetical protein